MRILVAEPSPDVRELLVRAIEESGHRAEIWQGEPAGPPASLDLLMGEPADPSVLALAHALRRTRPDLPIVWVSVVPPSRATRALSPSAHLVKPFSLAELGAAIQAALSPSAGSAS